MAVVHGGRFRAGPTVSPRTQLVPVPETGAADLPHRLGEVLREVGVASLVARDGVELDAELCGDAGAGQQSLDLEGVSRGRLGHGRPHPLALVLPRADLLETEQRARPGVLDRLGEVRVTAEVGPHRPVAELELVGGLLEGDEPVGGVDRCALLVPSDGLGVVHVGVRAHAAARDRAREVGVLRVLPERRRGDVEIVGEHRERLHGARRSVGRRRPVAGLFPALHGAQVVEETAAALAAAHRGRGEPVALGVLAQRAHGDADTLSDGG